MVRLSQRDDPEDEEKGFYPLGRGKSRGFALCERFFDIVNGFFNRCRGAWVMGVLGFA